jgi:TetR/AcrR family transcriptional regulator, acrAB operon repressor
MVRRTKADAQATRSALLDAAEHLFQARGVSRTSLNDIALAAGTTRGAIYWHFKDKADLFNAMMERITLPMEESLQCAIAPQAQDPVAEIRAAMLAALRKMATDEQTRRVFEVATHKVEYVAELQAVQERRLRVRNECLARTEQAMAQAVSRRALRLPLAVGTAALGLHVMLDGLIQNWLLDPAAFDLEATGREVVDAYLAGLGLGTPAP